MIKDNPIDLSLIKIGDVPDEYMTTSDEMYSAGRRVPSAQRKLQEASIYFEEYNDGQVGFYVMPKRNPYVSEPALDHMIYIAKEGGTIGNISDLSPELAVKLFYLARGVSKSYENLAGEHGGILLQVWSLNYHEDPIYDSQVFGKKVHAQSIRDMHLHVFALTKDTYRSLAKVDSGTLSRPLRDYMHDPFKIILNYLYETDLMTTILDPSIFQRIEGGRFEGISFSFDCSVLQDISFFGELIRLHLRLEELYKCIGSLYVDLESYDSKGMPVLHTKEEVANNIQRFLLSLSSYPASLKTVLYRLANIIKPGESITSPSERVFLRSLAYTMSIVYDVENNQYMLNLAPRVFSTGNALTSLRLLYQKVPLVDDNWLVKRSEREKYIRNSLVSES